MFKEIRDFFANRAQHEGGAQPEEAAKTGMSEERPFLEGNRADSTAGAGVAPPAQDATASDAHSKKTVSSDDAGAAPTPQPAAPAPVPSKKEGRSPLEQKIIDEALKKCFDPEIPVDIWELGLIYSLSASPSGVVDVKMTLTAPGCPVAGSLPGEVEQKIKAVEGVTDARVEIVWDPPWNVDMMSRVARVMLGM